MRRNWSAAIIAACVTTVLTASAVVGVGYWQGRRTATLLRAGWNLQPVMVAQLDLPAGTVVRAEHFVEQETPSQLITRTSVHAGELVAWLGKPLKVPLLRGDGLLSSDFAPRPVATSCVTRARASARAGRSEEDAAVKEFLTALEARRKASRDGD